MVVSVALLRKATTGHILDAIATSAFDGDSCSLHVPELQPNVSRLVSNPCFMLVFFGDAVFKAFYQVGLRIVQFLRSWLCSTTASRRCLYGSALSLGAYGVCSNCNEIYFLNVVIKARRNVTSEILKYFNCIRHRKTKRGVPRGRGGRGPLRVNFARFKLFYSQRRGFFFLRFVAPLWRSHLKDMDFGMAVPL